MAVRVRFDARTAKKQINEALNTKIRGITTDETLYYDLASTYADMVTPYVPMKTGRLRDYTISDRRITWSGSNKGFDYAGQQYETYYSHYTTPGTGPYWDSYVQPGTAEWNRFIDVASLIVHEHVRNV